MSPVNAFIPPKKKKEGGEGEGEGTNVWVGIGPARKIRQRREERRDMCLLAGWRWDSPTSFSVDRLPQNRPLEVGVLPDPTAGNVRYWSPSGMVILRKFHVCCRVKVSWFFIQPRELHQVEREISFSLFSRSKLKPNQLFCYGVWSEKTSNHFLLVRSYIYIYIFVEGILVVQETAALCFFFARLVWHILFGEIFM